MSPSVAPLGSLRWTTGEGKSGEVHFACHSVVGGDSTTLSASATYKAFLLRCLAFAGLWCKILVPALHLALLLPERDRNRSVTPRHDQILGAKNAMANRVASSFRPRCGLRVFAYHRVYGECSLRFFTPVHGIALDFCFEFGRENFRTLALAHDARTLYASMMLTVVNGGTISTF